VINHLSAQDEQEHILAIFRSGELMCKSALFQLLHAMISIILAVVNILNGIVDFVLGILTIAKGVLCIAKLLLTQCQDLVELERIVAQRRTSWTQKITH